MINQGSLTFFCGKMGAGKSTKSKQIATEKNAVLFSEDEWLSALYPDQIKSFKDYLTYSSRLKPLVKSYVQTILSMGTNVVMDFPANTKQQRQWFLALASEINATHTLIFLNVSDEQCLTQIAQRRRKHPERAAFDTADFFHQVTQYFDVPNEIEGLNIMEIRGE